MHIAIAHNTGGKSDKIPNHTIVLNITIKVSVKMGADTNIGGQGYKWAEYRPLAKRHIVHLHDISCANTPESDATTCAALRQRLTYPTVRNSQSGIASHAIFSEELIECQHTMTIDLQSWGMIINKYQTVGRNTC